jgi:hypothetical protein
MAQITLNSSGVASNGSLLLQSNGTTTAVTIDASQNVGIGVTPSAWGSSYKAYQVGYGSLWTGTGSPTFLSVSANSFYSAVASAYVYSTTGVATDYYQNAGTHVWRTAASGTAGNTISFTQAMTLNANGVLALQGASTSANGVGITFPATQSASTDANTLDDYEEGTFTPTVAGTSTVGTGTYVAQVGTFTKVGRVVSFTIYIKWTAHTGTGNLTIASLPFTNHSADVPVVVGYIATLSLTASNIATALIPASQAYIYMYQYPTGGGSSAVVPMDTSADIELSGTYFSSV